MKRIIFMAPCILAMIFLISGCPLRIEGVAVSRYPDRLVYVAGYDTELDLTGGEIVYYMDDGSKQLISMKSTTFSFSHDIDFNTPGVYVVESKYYNKKNPGIAFAIQVVDKDYIDNILNKLDSPN